MLVTGATSGIGWKLACQLAQSGVGVVALGRDPERLRALDWQGTGAARAATLGTGLAAAPDAGQLNSRPS